MLGLDTAYLCKRFDHCSFSNYRDMADAHQNLNGSRDLTTPLSGMVYHPRASTCYDQPTVKSELSNSIHNEDTKSDTKSQNLVGLG